MIYKGEYPLLKWKNCFTFSCLLWQIKKITEFFWYVTFNGIEALEKKQKQFSSQMVCIFDDCHCHGYWFPMYSRWLVSVTCIMLFAHSNCAFRCTSLFVTKCRLEEWVYSFFHTCYSVSATIFVSCDRYNVYMNIYSINVVHIRITSPR